MTSEWNQRQQHFFPHAFRSLLCIWFVAVAIRSEEEVCQRRGPSVTYFCPILDPPLGGSGRKTTTLVGDHEYFIPTKFHQNPPSSSGEEVENVKSSRTDDDGRRTTTDDGRCMMTIAHWSLRLLCAKNVYTTTKKYFKVKVTRLRQENPHEIYLSPIFSGSKGIEQVKISKVGRTSRSPCHKLWYEVKELERNSRVRKGCHILHNCSF